MVKRRLKVDTLAILNQEAWHRVAFVFYTAPKNGVFEVYIDGELAGVKEFGEIDQRWALEQSSAFIY